MPKGKPAEKPSPAGASSGESARNSEAPTPQGFQSAGPGNLHGLPPDDSPAQGAQNDRPFSPEGGRPAADPEAASKQLLDQARQGPPAEGDAGPLGAEEEARQRAERES